MIIKKHIVYAGIENPSTSAELKVELLGLENAVQICNELISRYKQVFAIMELTREGLNATQNISAEENSKDGGATGAISNREELEDENK